MKQQLSEALRKAATYEGMTLDEERSVFAAARLVERLLPGGCEACDGFRGVDVRAYPGEVVTAVTTCPVCYGSGQVWDEGIVEAVAQALKAGIADHSYRAAAIVALSALVELLTEKVEEPPKDPWDYDP